MSTVSDSTKTGADWNAYGNEYQQLMTKIPFPFNRHAMMLLFPELQNKIGLSQIPINVVDIAAGPGVFFHVLFQHMLENHVYFSPASHLLVTDIAESMLTSARESLLSASFTHEQLTHLGINQDDTANDERLVSLNFQQLNARLTQEQLPIHSFTHLVCMFGIMFFGDSDARAQALRGMHAVLKPDTGRAVIGTWQSVAVLGLCNEFGEYLDPLAVSKRPPSDTSPLEIGKNPTILREELLQAGFKTVEIHEIEETFVISTKDEGFFHALFTNPPVLKMYPEFGSENIAPEELRRRWYEFVARQVTHFNGTGWVRVDPLTDERTIVLPYRANLAVAIA